MSSPLSSPAIAIVDLPARRVAGISVRTSFERAGDDAGRLWQRAFAEGLVASGRPLFGVYTDYDSDYRGAYTMLIGSEVDDGGVVLPAGRYARIAADGEPSIAIPHAWQFVWRDWPDRARRAYRADFEAYGARGPNTADVYVGLGEGLR